MRPQTLKEVVKRVQAGAEERVAIHEFLDEFYMSIQGPGGHAGSQLMIDEEPAVLGRQPFDAYIGGIGEHLARRWGLKIPTWVEDERRFLDRPSFSDNAQLAKPVLLQDSPIAFRRRLIFTEAEPLRRGRFPKQERSTPTSHPDVR